MSIAGILRRWVLVSAVTGVLALIQVPSVRAKAVSSSPAVSPAAVGSNQPVQMPPNPNPNQPVPTAPSPGPLNSPAMEHRRAGRRRNGARDSARNGARDGARGAPGMAPGTPPPPAPAGYSSGLSTLDVIYESLFGNIYTKEDIARWTPMTLSGFFSEGWDTPYVFPKNTDNGTPRHAWLEALGGVFIVPGFLHSSTPICTFPEVG